jgi:nucleoside-diphosphate-sugar epimerase
LPPRIEDEAALERLLAEPTDGVVKTMRRIDGDVMLLGAGGKMGPSMARMIQRASAIAGIGRQVFCVSRFENSALPAQLQAEGFDVIRCDLLDSRQVAKLPQAANIVYLAGMKFGATGQEPRTWAMNALLPAIICQKFSECRIIAFSTGNIYGLAPVASGGSRETDEPAPVGEYAMSCLGRERVFEYFGSALNTPIVLNRLNYACDLRYGVLVDLAHRVWHRQPIDLATGYFNTIWQGDANAMALQTFVHASRPPFVINITGPELLSVREVCDQFGRLMDRSPIFVGTETSTALLGNAEQACALLGRPRVTADCLVAWVADWTMRDNPTHGKPTRFESRDGKF